LAPFISDDKASAYAWTVVLVTLFVLVICWGVMGPITETVYNHFQDSGAIMPEMVAPMNTIMSVWRWFPVVVLFGMILWGIAYSVYHEAGHY